jgi:hypothetical protein
LFVYGPRNVSVTNCSPKVFSATSEGRDYCLKSKLYSRTSGFELNICKTNAIDANCSVQEIMQQQLTKNKLLKDQEAPVPFKWSAITLVVRVTAGKS